MSDALSMLKNNTTCLNEYSKLLEKVIIEDLMSIVL